MGAKGLLISFCLCVAGIVGLAWLLDNQIPNSTKGVTIVGDNEARLPVRETFILTHMVGNVMHYYTITYDGDRSVRFQCGDWFCNDHTATVSDVDQTVDVDMGWWSEFHVTLHT
ncbi:MAG TPA: hypothetical protein VM581_01780, partial [Magnetospirillaceae bacterium]|nr:hypothetical protein [Magnetospirillaceae bacterium]